MIWSVSAFDVEIQDYQTELSDKLLEYDSSFDDCFPALSTDFPDLSVSILELDRWIEDMDFDTWYHRTITLSGSEANEAFFAFKTDMEYFAIRVVYMVNEANNSISVYDVDFYGSSDGLESEMYNFFSIPNGVTEKSLEEIAACVNATPGFEMVMLLCSIMVFLLFCKKKK
jgi:hypothetical protein